MVIFHFYCPIMRQPIARHIDCRFLIFSTLWWLFGCYPFSFVIFLFYSTTLPHAALSFPTTFTCAWSYTSYCKCLLLMLISNFNAFWCCSTSMLTKFLVLNIILNNSISLFTQPHISHVMIFIISFAHINFSFL